MDMSTGRNVEGDNQLRLFTSDIENVACVHCGAQPGFVCLGRTREPLPYPHVERIRKYRQVICA